MLKSYLQVIYLILITVRRLQRFVFNFRLPVQYVMLNNEENVKQHGQKAESEFGRITKNRAPIICNSRCHGITGGSVLAVCILVLYLYLVTTASVGVVTGVGHLGMIGSRGFSQACVI